MPLLSVATLNDFTPGLSQKFTYPASVPRTVGRGFQFGGIVRRELSGFFKKRGGVLAIENFRGQSPE